jgi:hypothetical protein
MRASSLRRSSAAGLRALKLSAIAGTVAIGVWACTDQTFTIPTPPDVPTNGSLSGVVVENGTTTPVAGAQVRVGGTAVVTDAEGRFTLADIPSSGDGALTVSAPGYVLRSQMYALAEARSGVLVDLIPERPPFSLLFYRFFVRDGFESGQLQRTLPWTVDPSFYVMTTVENSTFEVDPAVIAAIEANFRASVPALSGGRRQVAAFETGPGPRPETEGWVNVIFSLDLQGAFGRSTVGGNRGTMWLRWNLTSNAQNNTFECSSPEVFIADHEITHSMGFWHTPDLLNDTFSGPGCPGGPRPEHTALHANIMYSRPRGNRDPDIDPQELINATAPGVRPVVSCRLR